MKARCMVWVMFLAGCAALAQDQAQKQAQNRNQAMPGMAMGPMAGMRRLPPPAELPAPVRMTGIGNAHIAITATPEAQTLFDQGLNLIHDFWDYEAERAFEQAVRVDPGCAMCQWGLAYALAFRGDEQQGYADQALARAVALKRHAGGAEKLYLEALAAEMAARKRGADDSRDAVAVYRRLVKKQPRELEPRILLANALNDGYDDKGEPKAGTKEAIAMLEGVLRDAPNDSAANHYWIHALEPGNHPERALASAERLASLAPTSGHMVHMPGHIFYRVGRYGEAEKWFMASTSADEAYMRAQHVGPDDDWNYMHNMMYSIANLMEQGRLSEANALSDRLAGARGELSASLYVWSARDSMARLSNRLPVALRLGDWQGVLQLLASANLQDDPKTANLRMLAASLRDYAAGMQALTGRKVEEARAASARLDAGLWRAEQDAERKKAARTVVGDAKAEGQPTVEPAVAVMPDAMDEPIRKAIAVASMELRAGVLVAEGKIPEAKELYTAALAEEKKLGYHEPPLYVRPVGETEAEALLRAQDWKGAETAYATALEERPNSGFGLYGVALAKQKSGDTAGAQAAYRSFLAAWPQADPALPEVVQARAALAGGTVTPAAGTAAGASLRP